LAARPVKCEERQQTCLFTAKEHEGVSPVRLPNAHGLRHGGCPSNRTNDSAGQAIPEPHERLDSSSGGFLPLSCPREVSLPMSSHPTWASRNPQEQKVNKGPRSACRWVITGDWPIDGSSENSKVELRNEQFLTRLLSRETKMRVWTPGRIWGSRIMAGSQATPCLYGLCWKLWLYLADRSPGV
jgi:hypothetical protein